MKQPRYDFVGRTRLWAIISAILMLVAILGILVRGLNLSIDFEGGTSFTVEGITADVTSSQITDAVEAAGGEDVRAQLVSDTSGTQGALVRLSAVDIDGQVSDDVEAALADVTGSPKIEESFVGPTWGAAISRKALEALIVFLIVVVIYISVRLEAKMAGAAILALVHDVLLTVGVYAWFEFTVSPNTVIALLTILGYSLYDTVVVFDRVEENRAYLGRPGRRTYSQMVNTSHERGAVALDQHLGDLAAPGRGAAADRLPAARGDHPARTSPWPCSSAWRSGPTRRCSSPARSLAWWVEREPDMQDLHRKHRDDGEELIAPEPHQAAASRRPITTEYVRGEGKGKRRRR